MTPTEAAALVRPIDRLGMALLFAIGLIFVLGVLYAVHTPSALRTDADITRYERTAYTGDAIAGHSRSYGCADDVPHLDDHATADLLWDAQHPDGAELRVRR